MTLKKIDFTANSLAFIYSLLLIMLFAVPLSFGFLGFGRAFLFFSLIGWILVLLSCASFFLLANRETDTGVYWFLSGMLLNFALTYVFLLLWKFSYIFIYTSLGQIADIRLNKMFLLKAVILYSVSYLMICFGFYEVTEKGNGAGGKKDADLGDKL